MKLLKQWIDRRAISLATKVLPAPGVPKKCEREAAALLSDPCFLTPPARTADLTFDREGGFAFPSNVTTPAACNNVVHGKLFRSGENWRSRPTVILVHGWNAELHYLYGFPRLARALNRRGLNAMLFELPYHLQRRPKHPHEMRDFISDDLIGMLTATRQAIADIEALVNWNNQHASGKAAVWGFSLGAWLAGLHLTHSPHSSAAVLTTPVSNLALAIETLPFCFPIRAALDHAPVALDCLNLASRIPLIPVENILVTESLYDLFAPSHTFVDLAQKWKLPEWERVPQSHISILLSRRCMNRAMDWLKARLDD